MPPLTGESTHTMFRSANPRATMVAMPGPVVDRSITVRTLDPCTRPRSPSATACTMLGVGRLMSTIEAVDATSCGDAAAFAPRSVSGFIAAALVSNTHSEWPASNSLDAMGPPMFPRPTNPSS